MYIRRQKFLVLGVSKSGNAAAKLILKEGGKVFIVEESKNQKALSAVESLLKLGAKRLSGNVSDEVILSFDMLVLSPGVPINHPLCVRAKKLGVRIAGELEFAYERLCPRVVAVTGTNGKTTTVSLINKVLGTAGVPCSLAGNIGIPLSDRITEDKTEDTAPEKERIYLLEVSSFQLESISEMKPHIACVTNVTPDHLERHYTMENYVFLKSRIVKNLTSSEYAVLNFDDGTVRGFEEGCKGKIVWVSCEEKVDGAYLSGDKLCFRGREIASVNDLTVNGTHNVYNALFCIAVCCLLGVDADVIKKGLCEFSGVSHRIQFVGEVKGIKFFDDSKATNTASTVSAIDSMKAPTVLILGGSEKGERYNALFKKIKNSAVTHVVLTGASKRNMLAAAEEEKYASLTVTEDFTSAVKIAFAVAERGGNVLLSPACASFDRFRNYEERGDFFVKTVGEIKGEIASEK